MVAVVPVDSYDSTGKPLQQRRRHPRGNIRVSTSEMKADILHTTLDEKAMLEAKACLQHSAEPRSLQRMVFQLWV